MMFLFVVNCCALVGELNAAEPPRYPSTTGLKNTGDSKDLSLGQKVKGFFSRDKQPQPNPTRFGHGHDNFSDRSTDQTSSRTELTETPEYLWNRTSTGTLGAEPASENPIVRNSYRRPPEPQAIPLGSRDFMLEKSGKTSGSIPPASHGDLNLRKAYVDQANFNVQTEVPPAEPPAEFADPPIPNGDPVFIPPTDFEPTRVPLEEAPESDNVKITNEDDTISLIVRDAPVGTVLSLIAENQGINIITAGQVSTRISVTLSHVSLEDALNAILASTGYTWIRKNGIIIISPLTGGENSTSQVHGKILRVFNLNFLSAIDVDKTVQGLLSPIGSSFVNETSADDNRRTQETIVVEDLPEYVDRIAAYIQQSDIPPRQVLIEARILEVDLRDELSHGVNLTALADIAGAEVSFKTQGFASPLKSPAFLFGIDGTDLDALLEALQTTTDTKTLANPKLLVLNGQEARIQIGAQLGFLVTTTTETSTLQNVQFLDVGVVLSVVPRISDDRRVMMTVKPEVSEGQINLITGLPEEETTEVETSVMVGSGEGMVIGGLIKEVDNDVQNKIPILGDLWGVGRFFQRRRAERRRTEIIIVLTPHILPYTYDKYCEHQVEVERVMTPLLEGQLQPVERPWEPELPDAIYDPRIIDWKRLKGIPQDLKQPYPKPIEYYVPSIQEKYGLQPYSGPVFYPEYPPICDDDTPVNNVPVESIRPESWQLQPVPNETKYATTEPRVEPTIMEPAITGPTSTEPVQPVAYQEPSRYRPHREEPSGGLIGPDQLFQETYIQPLYHDFELKPVTEVIRHD